MLTVAEARAKARRRLTSSMAAWAAEPVSDVRIEIALHPPTERQVLADQAAAAAWAASWRAVESKEHGTSASGRPASARDGDGTGPRTASGLDIDWNDRNWPRVGRQRVPVRLRLSTPDAVASFVGGDTADDWRTLRDRAAVIRQRFGDVLSGAVQVDVEDPVGRDAEGDAGDRLAAAIRSQAKRILSLSAPGFDTVIAVVEWLRGHRLGSLRPRQLPIRGVDSKWFETHRGLVTALLGGIGHTDAVTVLDAEPRLRLRILDPALTATKRSGATAEPGDTATQASTIAPAASLDDITAPISQLSRLPMAPRLVFVFENLESVLAMPAWQSAVAVHGSGYAVDGVARLDWIAGARVIYWGDLDSHGFAILNRLRTHLPQTESVLMDEATLLAHDDLWVAEPKPATGTFVNLTGTELRALERLRAEGSVRLEQERIPWETALNRLRTVVGDATESRLGETADAGTEHAADGQDRLGEGMGHPGQGSD